MLIFLVLVIMINEKKCEKCFGLSENERVKRFDKKFGGGIFQLFMSLEFFSKCVLGVIRKAAFSVGGGENINWFERC